MFIYRRKYEKIESIDMYDMLKLIDPETKLSCDEKEITIGEIVNIIDEKIYYTKTFTPIEKGIVVDIIHTDFIDSFCEYCALQHIGAIVKFHNNKLIRQKGK